MAFCASNAQVTNGFPAKKGRNFEVCPNDGVLVSNVLDLIPINHFQL